MYAFSTSSVYKCSNYYISFHYSAPHCGECITRELRSFGLLFPMKHALSPRHFGRKFYALFYLSIADIAEREPQYMSSMLLRLSIYGNARSIACSSKNAQSNFRVIIILSGSGTFCIDLGFIMYLQCTSCSLNLVEQDVPFYQAKRSSSVSRPFLLNILDIFCG